MESHMINTLSQFLAKSSALSRFKRDENGNIAIMFGLTLVPLLLFMGAAVDYTRANEVHTRLQASIDATALALTHEPKGTPLATLKAKGQKMFEANFAAAAGEPVPVIDVDVQAKTIKVSTSSVVNTSFIKIGGQDTITVGANSVAAFGTKNLELALVLDNTGSMGKNGKIEALRAAVSKTLTDLQAKSKSPGDIKVSLVPFTTQVKVAKTFVNAPWLRWDVTLENTNLSSADRAPPTLAAWTGCLSDRDQSYDALSVPANGLQSKYPASVCQNDGLLAMMPLTSDLDSIRAQSNQMQPLNNTNVTIGFVNGMSTLRPDHPFGTGSVDNSNTEKYLVLLTDGDNTANRYGDNHYSPLIGAPVIDARLKAACQQAKTDGKVKVITIRVMDGNAALLQSCASDPSLYYDVQNAGQIQGAFDDIFKKITQVHLQS
jgi:Flp pilus assembly protein TadG